jgi:hypothetical protein
MDELAREEIKLKQLTAERDRLSRRIAKLRAETLCAKRLNADILKAGHNHHGSTDIQGKSCFIPLAVSRPNRRLSETMGEYKKRHSGVRTRLRQ